MKGLLLETLWWMAILAVAGLLAFVLAVYGLPIILCALGRTC